MPVGSKSYRVRRRAIAFVAFPLFALGLAIAPVWAGSDANNNVGAPIKDLGEPIVRVLSQVQAFGKGLNGEPQVYFVAQGNADTPAEFAAVDIRTKKTVFAAGVPRGVSSWAITVSPQDDAVYFGTNDTGDLYRYRLGSDLIEHLGVPLEGETIWALSAAPGGRTVYGGTYPSGKVFSYDVDTGNVRDYGQAVAGETYVRSLESTNDTVYVGTQPNMKLAALNPDIGTFTQITLPPKYQSQQGGISDLSLRKSRLFVNGNDLMIWDVSTHEWVDEIEEMNGRAVSPIDPATENTVYFRIDEGNIVRYNLDTLSYEKTAWAPNTNPGAFAWVDMQNPDLPGASLIVSNFYTRLYVQNFTTKKGEYFVADLAGAGTNLTTLGTGPDNNVYIGGFLSPPGMSRWQPDVEKFELLPGAGQVEAFGTWKGNLLHSRYPLGKIYNYQVSKPWEFGKNPGPEVVLGEEQDRAITFADLGEQVAVGSVPVSGRLGGAVTLWNPDTRAIRVFRNLVPDQTPVSLVSRGGLVYGGTSIHGGYGIDPATTEGTLFIWDPVTQKTTFQTVPIPGGTLEDTVSGLAFDSEGFLWGLAEGSVFQFDPKTKKILRHQQLFDDLDDSRFGNDHVLVFYGDQLFGVTEGQFFHLDPKTWRAHLIATSPIQQLPTGTTGGIRHLTKDNHGNLYFAVGSHLYQYRPMQSAPDEWRPTQNLGTPTQAKP